MRPRLDERKNRHVMANRESYLLDSIQISTICFPFSNNFNAIPRSTMQARTKKVLMMSNRPLLRSVSACALPFRHAWQKCARAWSFVIFGDHGIYSRNVKNQWLGSIRKPRPEFKAAQNVEF